jgi:hypothetical protein
MKTKLFSRRRKKRYTNNTKNKMKKKEKVIRTYYLSYSPREKKTCY